MEFFHRLIQTPCLHLSHSTLMRKGLIANHYLRISESERSFWFTYPLVQPHIFLAIGPAWSGSRGSTVTARRHTIRRGRTGEHWACPEYTAPSLFFEALLAPRNTQETSGSSEARNQVLFYIFPPAYRKAIPALGAQLILGDTCGPTQFQILTITQKPSLTIYLFYISKNICQDCNLLCFSTSTPTSQRYDPKKFNVTASADQRPLHMLAQSQAMLYKTTEKESALGIRIKIWTGECTPGDLW